MKLEFHCSNCGVILEASLELAGLAITCEKCNNQEIVPCLFRNLVPPDDNEAAWPRCPIYKHMKFYLTAIVYNSVSPQAMLCPGLLMRKIHQCYKSELKAYSYETVYREKLQDYSRKSLVLINKQ